MAQWAFPMVAAVMSLTGPEDGYAERIAHQSFHVHVSPRMAIRCPTLGLVPPLLPLDRQIPVHLHAWDIATNSRCGATIQMTTEQSFHAVNDPRERLDAQLELKILSQSPTGNWIVTHPIAATDYRSGEEIVQVQACTFHPGSVALGLTVRSLGDDTLTSRGGAYEATVVATITAH